MKVKKIEDSAITDSAARNSIFLNIGLPPSLERLIYSLIFPKKMTEEDWKKS
jgi:hypothetical protein